MQRARRTKEQEKAFKSKLIGSALDPFSKDKNGASQIDLAKEMEALSIASELDVSLILKEAENTILSLENGDELDNDVNLESDAGLADELLELTKDGEQPTIVECYTSTMDINVNEKTRDTRKVSGGLKDAKRLSDKGEAQLDSLLMRIKTVAEARKRIEEQILQATKISGYYYHQVKQPLAKNSRQSNSDVKQIEHYKSKAIEMHKIKKQSQRSLELVDSLLASGVLDTDPITVVKQEMIYEKLEEEQLHVAPNQLQVSIQRITGLDELMLAGGEDYKNVSLAPPDTFLVISIPIYSSDSIESAGHKDKPNEQTVNSPVFKKAFHPEYSFKTLFQIENGRGYQRFIERKKLVIQVMQYRGFFKKNVCLGKVSIPLNGILTQSVVSLDGTILLPASSLENTRKKTVRSAKLFGSLTVRSPIGCDGSTKPVTKIQETWIQIDGNMVSFSPTFQLSKASFDSVSTVSVNAKDEKRMSKSLENTEMFEIQFYDANNIQSNLVLEKELEEIDRLLSQPSPMISSELLETLQYRKENYLLRKQVLSCQVETGILTPEAYLAYLKRSIDETKEQALACKRLERMDLAKISLSRIKLMQQEISELESMT